jgi:FkbM family methyltransferase
MSSLLRYLNKPEYLFQPQTIARKLLSSRRRGQSATRVPLPWGISMEVDPRETIGRSLCNHGLFEIAVVEALFRLIDPGDLVLDVGANIGFMSAAAAASRAASVIAFEPHPVLFERLARNFAEWTTQRADMQGRLRALQVAISDAAGEATLHIPDAFSGNQGIASLVDCAPTAGMTTVAVRCVTIDQVIAEEGRPVGLMKIDVEGHEMAALRGAAAALQQRRIRDIIFEDHRGIDSDVCRVLTSHGYSIYFLGKLPWGPILCTPANSSRAAAISFDSPNFLATLDHVRAEARMGGWGYRCVA